VTYTSPRSTNKKSPVGLGFVWIIPSCVPELSAAATELKREYPKEFGESDGLSLAFGLYVFSYSCGFLVGPTLAGIIKAKASWGAATVVLASACVVACIPFLVLLRSRSR
jgi:MFS family permease